jgi:hypothetical protein
MIAPLITLPPHWGYKYISPLSLIRASLVFISKRAKKIFN